MIKKLDYFTLKLLLDSSKDLQKSFLKLCSKDFVRFLCECCRNLVHGNLKVANKIKLIPLKQIIKQLISKKTSLKQRRFLLACDKGIILFRFIAQAVLDKFQHLFDNRK